jgi:hypothetical protein
MRHETKIKAYKECAWGIMGFLAWLLFLLLAWALAGCKSIEYVPVVEHKTDTTYITKNHRDSIYVHDSTYIHERGDTVWIERWHTRWRDRLLLDTIYETVHDTIPLPVGTGTWQTSMPRTRPPGSATGSSLTWWQQTRIYIGNIAIFAAIIMLIILYVKSRIKP